jgi:hypothetical protein
MKRAPLSTVWRAGCVIAFGALALAHGTLAGETQKAPVLVELFTSQGCSSCPQADQILGELQRRDDVVALSFSIDYWDYIGWRDTLASHENTLRQQTYEKVLPSHRVYTPQMVVDGAEDVVGNQRSQVLEVIAKRAKAASSRVAISLKQSGDTVQVRIAGGAGQPATVWLAHTLSSRTVNISRGENGGKVITYHNVVRDYAAVGKWSGQALSLDLPAQGMSGEVTDAVAVWLQTNGQGPVLGAAQLRVTK